MIGIWFFDATRTKGEYDNLDRIGLGRVTIAPRVRPARIQARLHLAGGKTVASLDTALQPPLGPDAQRPGLALMAATESNVFRLVFDPSPLPPGAYELAVKVLDQQAHELAAQTLSFTRAADY